MKILVGISGGIDSAVAAYLLKQQGHDVIGITMSIYDGSIPVPISQKSGRAGRSGCFGPGEAKSLQDAKRLAERIGVQHHVISLATEYHQEVLDYFRQEYLAGHTPNPCVMCNRKMKFDALPNAAHKVGIDFDLYATGHYARIYRHPATNRYVIKRSKDPVKDQTYFISHLSQSQLANIIFPLGDLTKTEVRKIAEKLGWDDLLKREESQDFIACDSYSSLFKSGESRPGDIINAQGKVLGQHKGLIYYTIGQRKGLGIGGGTPYYVLQLDAINNRVILGEKKDLYSQNLFASKLNWGALSPENIPVKGLPVLAQIRQRHTPAPAILKKRETDELQITFEQPQLAITPGQIVACYCEDELIVAGTIAAR